MQIPKDLFDLSCVDDINVMGKGGKEQIIKRIIPRWKRVNKPLYDFEIDHNGMRLRLEVKKQKDIQWFDSGKYYELSAIDRNIKVLFIIHNKGKINALLVASLGHFIDWLCANRQSDGWATEVMKVAADFKTKFPSLQFKAKAKIAEIFKENPQIFDVIYQKN